ncbi:nitrate- and nitrite sensing domain-containing protein [Nocardiopsis sp. HNM0947]|uniref:histidine kinase n=1 Tax=Nocardiopsis coralli TaxID=2772213 RepID=A0ABR9P8I8_9ACTN|nr:nitrate- and nitrite sensing domain-containing protein [Nocardiopsis coralli]MBE3000005.1 nitrate- and nitrite sensing domain-containing protein [Nocardiopsis coralli]
MQAVPKRRGRSITARIRAMVMIPTSALVALWLILTGVLGTWAVFQLMLANATEDLVTPAAVGLVDAMEERSATIAHLEDPDDPQVTQDLAEARQATDDSLGVVVEDLIGFADLAPGDGGMHIEMLHGMYQDIGEIRDSVDSGNAGRDDVLDYYNELVLHGADSFDSQGREGNSGDAVSPGFSAIYMFRTVDTLAQADAQVARAFSTGELTVEDQREFTRLVGAYDAFLEANAHYLSEEQAERYEAVIASPEWERLKGYEQEIIDRQVESGTVTDPVTLEPENVDDLTMPVDAADWHDAHQPVRAELTDIGAEEAVYAASMTRAGANTWVYTAIGGSLGVAAVITVATLLARRSSRELTGQLLKLRDDSDDLARKKLPELMGRLHRGERVDTKTALPELERSDDEIGDVAEAFNTAQRAAVDEAVQQTELRHGVNRVFLNIAHRSQTLVHRQLRLLDKMEREQEDPEQLGQLFKLDHLATRSRRNAENLLILGGEAPGRTWHRPMPLIDVLRGAISESGDYTRVKRERIARVHLNGPAVADVIHLVAELVDNATMFSPPHTSVRLSSDDVPNGVTVEIEDRGLGMSDGELSAANSLLAEPPEFDVMRLNEKMRLGLFVVSHLAHRHGIKVHLRASPYGGVQAIVLLPQELISGDRASLPASPDTGEDIWEVRQISGPGEDTDSGSTGGTDTASGASDTNGDGQQSGQPDTEPAKPVLTSVPSAPAGTPADTGETPAAPADPAPQTGGEDTGNGTGAPAGGSDVLAAGPDSPAPQEQSSANGSSASRPPLPTRTSKIAAVPAEDGSRDGGSGSDGDGQGRPALPKRRPQENLAPQLAADPAPSSGGAPRSGGPSGGETNSAERLARLRKNMSAFQKGTDRGRRDGKQQTNETDKDE